jgi:hypothetical protein
MVFDLQERNREKQRGEVRFGCELRLMFAGKGRRNRRGRREGTAMVAVHGSLEDSECLVAESSRGERRELQ